MLPKERSRPDGSIKRSVLISYDLGLSNLSLPFPSLQTASTKVELVDLAGQIAELCALTFTVAPPVSTSKATRLVFEGQVDGSRPATCVTHTRTHWLFHCLHGFLFQHGQSSGNLASARPFLSRNSSSALELLGFKEHTWFPHVREQLGDDGIPG